MFMVSQIFFNTIRLIKQKSLSEIADTTKKKRIITADMNDWNSLQLKFYKETCPLKFSDGIKHLDHLLNHASLLNLY